MIDENVEKAVDWLCRATPAFIRPHKIRLANSGPGWRILLYARSFKRAIARLLAPIRSEETMDLFMRETAEIGDDQFARMSRVLKAKKEKLLSLASAGLEIRCFFAFFFMALAALGTAFAGGQEMALCAAACCLLWIADTMEAGYKPFAAHQKYVVSMLMHAAAATVLLPGYFMSYLGAGDRSNVVLQSSMIVMLMAHTALFLALIAFNRHQPLFLRALSGVLGAGPALMAAAAVALGAARIATAPASAVLSAAGACAVFASDRLNAVTTLGGIRLRHGALFSIFFESGGFALMLLGAWLAP